MTRGADSYVAGVEWVQQGLHVGQIGTEWHKMVDCGERRAYCGTIMQRTRLFGTYEHTVDDKGRVTLPAEFREHFAAGAVLARLPIQEHCVMVFSEQDWEAYEDRYINSLNTYDDFDDDWDSRSIFARMSLCKPDKQGRVSLVQGGIAEGLDLTGKVAILGNRDRLEIWNPATLAAEMAKYRERKAKRDARREGSREP